MSVVVESENTYSRLLGWEVWNFMSIKHGMVEFDESNVINLKGYNDSGKSAMLRALDVLMSNIRPNRQVDFIQDNTDYFRVVAYFSDGVRILRDKYINGQSLYEMYKGDDLIFTTKNGKTLTKVPCVPEPIQQYLGLISFDDTVLNSRSCFEKQIGVQNTGSENYKMFNTVLKSEEIASAGARLNNDKNKLVTQINGTESELKSLRGLLEGAESITQEMVDWLKTSDSRADSLEAGEAVLSSAVSVKGSLDSIKVPPQTFQVQQQDLDAVYGLASTASELAGIEIAPEVWSIDAEVLSIIERLYGVSKELSSVRVHQEVSLVDSSALDLLGALASEEEVLSGISVPPVVGLVDSERLDALSRVSEIFEDYRIASARLESLEEDLQGVYNDIERYNEELKISGVSTIRCPNCGHLIIQGDEHEH